MKNLLFFCLLFFAVQSDAQTFGKMEGVKLDRDCQTFTVIPDATELMVVAADKNGNEVTRWYFPISSATVTPKTIVFKRGLRTYELSRPVSVKK